MPTAQLTDRSLILVRGPDAEHFLQNLITTDLDGLPGGAAKPGALLSPQGKILFDFLVSRAGDDALRIDCRADFADDLLRRLTLYRLRARVELSKQEQAVVLARWEKDSGTSDDDSGWLADTRFPEALHVRRGYGLSVAADVDAGAWNALRIANGIAEGGADYQLGDAFPHDVLLDLSGGVGFRKGCYVGQEVVSRMQHRGTARRRVMQVAADAALPSGGGEVTVNGRTIGALGATDGTQGLAVVRIDRVRDALDAGIPILAGEVPVRLSIPAWAGYTLPADPAGAGDG